MDDIRFDEFTTTEGHLEISVIFQFKSHFLIDKSLASAERIQECGKQHLTSQMIEHMRQIVREHDMASAVGREQWVVQLQPDCWLSSLAADPDRTMVRTSARRYHTQADAEAALDIIKVSNPHRHFRTACVVPL